MLSKCGTVRVLLWCPVLVQGGEQGSAELCVTSPPLLPLLFVLSPVLCAFRDLLFSRVPLALRLYLQSRNVSLKANLLDVRVYVT